MEIKYINENCIITPLSPRLDKREVNRLINELAENNLKKIGLNMDLVKDFTIDFLEGLKNKEISLFNVPSDLFSLLNMMNYTQNFTIFASEMDFLENKREVKNRKFQLV